MYNENYSCNRCLYECNARRFQKNFDNWTSVTDALEWIPYDRFCDVKYIVNDEIYKAKRIDGYISYWNYVNENWEREGQHEVLILKSLNNLNNISLEFMKEIKKSYGITQDPRTKNYMMVTNSKCKKCDEICNAMYFQQNFNNWTSGNDVIDKYIQDTQLLAHDDANKALEWIPYDRLFDIKYVTEYKVYNANWTDGNVEHWDDENQNLIRKGQNMFVNLKSLNTSVNLTLEFANKVKIDHEFYGITQDPETKNYMMDGLDKAYRADWIDGYIKYWSNNTNQKWAREGYNMLVNLENLNAPINLTLEFTNKIKVDYEFYGITQNPDTKNYMMNIKYIAKDEFDEMYRANWINGYIECWNDKNQNWERKGHNMFVYLKNLDTPISFAPEFINKIKINYKFYGVTYNSETKNYMMILNNKCKICKTCNKICNAMYFQQNFDNWTSGNNDIDKFIQEIQLLAHNDAKEALEWIPYDRFYDIKYVASINVYRAIWIDGHINEWNNENQNWERNNKDMLFILKSLNDPKNMTLEFLNEVKNDYEFYGITQNPVSKNYLMVLNDKCTQLLAHNNTSVALEWISYDRFNEVKHIAKGGFGNVSKAIWIDGYIHKWDDEKKNWMRKFQHKSVALKSLDNSRNITFEFMNEIMQHHKINSYANIIKLYGITQDPETKNYMMVMDYAEGGSLRSINYTKLDWKNKISYLYDIAFGLNHMHFHKLIHRDLHIGNILLHRGIACITDMGLCKPADYNDSENTKNSIYGVLPYVAPEILLGKSYTKAADIYSFGIIMYEIISGLPPYRDVSHDKFLAIQICKGLRPNFKNNIPQLIVHLVKKCLDANPLNRPTALEISKILREWSREFSGSSKSDQAEIIKQIKEAEKSNNKSSTSYKSHSEAIYTSRLLNFGNLPEPTNSDDYYKQNASNKISMKYSESLRIDFQQTQRIDNSL
ncbi:kinase-like domain-containing protein [Rhizophagus clarus]|uniref:Kinase-like domain-containing protein n=1 Tax=Rhizophagus clarus TaxID=94130 RepID=A0A8H3M8F3_9GLOM|nr:kinase-like domain-containing protein [Rhizophagus clarus]